MTRKWLFLLSPLLLVEACTFDSRTGEPDGIGPIGGGGDEPPPPPPPPLQDNRAFGNVQPHHVSDPQYHDAIRAYGPHAVLVCNAGLPDRALLDDLRTLAGPDVTLLANDPADFVPLWGEDSEMWNAYRAAMDPATVGLPESAWYWLDENGERMLAPKACEGGGWCGDFWPGWALKPEPSAYQAKAQFLASWMADFDGLFMDDWHAIFAAYQVEGLGLPPGQQQVLTQQWIVCRRFYADRLREFAPPGFLLVPNLQPEEYTNYPRHEMVLFDGHTCEFPDTFDLARFRAYPSPYNVGWSGTLNAPGIVRRGFGLPANLDP